MANKRVIEFATALGLHIDTWSPGDGFTRYRVFPEKADYFGGLVGCSYGMFTGNKKETEIWLAGYASCLHRGEHNA